MILIIVVALIVKSISQSKSISRSNIVFNNNFFNDLTGELSGYVLFVQNSVIPARNNIHEDKQPHLTGKRKTMVLFKPGKEFKNSSDSVRITLKDKNGVLLTQMAMQPPHELPGIAGAEKINARTNLEDFKVPQRYDQLLYGQSILNKLRNKEHFFDQIKNHQILKIKTYNGNWLRDFNLPEGEALNGRTVVFHSQADYDSIVFYSSRSLTLKKGDILVLKNYRGAWYSAIDIESTKLTYGEFWSAILPAEFIEPGINLSFAYAGNQGRLNKIKVGAPTEVLLHNIDIGMLTPNRDKFQIIRQQAELTREYFHQIPVSRLIVNEYAPLYLQELMMPNGNLLTEYASDSGTVQLGSMRETIAKGLISNGINNANYGIHFSSPNSYHPYHAAQITAHNAIGRYKNGIVMHGLSGGSGIVTLMNSTGNEFSHELGHNYGLGHYPGGFDGSVHRPANEINSTWGWDSDENFFIPNFSQQKRGQSTCIRGRCQLPFNGYRFGTDAMAGGSPYSLSDNHYTLHTPYSLRHIQSFLESKAVFSKDSPTGFRKWNHRTQTMDAWENRVDAKEVVHATAKQVESKELDHLLLRSSKVIISFADGFWTPEIHIPKAAEHNAGKIVYINHGATYASNVKINSSWMLIRKGDEYTLGSDGRKWLISKGEPPSATMLQIPEKQGIEVITIFGFYDPENELQSYIYPTIHGAYGMVYKSDPAQVLENARCRLKVKTLNGKTSEFRLSGMRLSGKELMNRFHVNVERASRPSSASVICNGEKLATRYFDGSKASRKLSVTLKSNWKAKK